MTAFTKNRELGFYVNHSDPYVHSIEGDIYKMDRNHSNSFCKFLAANKTLLNEKNFPIHTAIIFCFNRSCSGLSNQFFGNRIQHYC